VAPLSCLGHERGGRTDPIYNVHMGREKTSLKGHGFTGRYNSEQLGDEMGRRGKKYNCIESRTRQLNRALENIQRMASWHE